VELSNDLAENAMRPVAIRRKNWIHLGQQGGWTKGSGYDLDRRNLSTPEHPGPCSLA
jgi:hypothetical protein